jgi:hypothetical protein
MRKFSIAALVCLGTLAVAGPSQAGPLSAPALLGSDASRAAMNEVTADEAATPARYNGRGYRGGRHYGWNRGYHYGPRYRYGYAPRYYAPRNYGYRNYGYGPRNYGYGVGPGIRLYW